MPLRVASTDGLARSGLSPTMTLPRRLVPLACRRLGGHDSAAAGGGQEAVAHGGRARQRFDVAAAPLAAARRPGCWRGAERRAVFGGEERDSSWRKGVAARRPTAGACRLRALSFEIGAVFGCFAPCVDDSETFDHRARLRANVGGEAPAAAWAAEATIDHRRWSGPCRCGSPRPTG